MESISYKSFSCNTKLVPDSKDYTSGFVRIKCASVMSTENECLVLLIIKNNISKAIFSL